MIDNDFIGNSIFKPLDLGKKTNKQFPQNGNFPYELTFYDIEILFLLEEESIPTKNLIKLLKQPKTNVYRSIERLEINVFIQKIDTLCEITKHGKKVIDNLKGYGYKRENILKHEKKKMRFHCIQGKFVVSTPPKIYDSLLQKYFTFATGKSKEEKSILFKMNGATVMFHNPTSIAVTFPEIFIPTINEHAVTLAYCNLSIMIERLKNKLELEFKGLKINKFLGFELYKQHIAIVESDYAKSLDKPLTGDRIITDKSKGKHELEAIHSKYAGEDIIECIKIEQSESYLNNQINISLNSGENFQIDNFSLEFQKPDVGHSNFLSYPRNELSPPTGI